MRNKRSCGPASICIGMHEWTVNPLGNGAYNVYRRSHRELFRTIARRLLVMTSALPARRRRIRFRTACAMANDASTDIHGANTMSLKRWSGRAPEMAFGGTMQRAALLLLVILASAAGMTASAQFDSGAVLGNIKDPSGATVASATVDLIS